MENRDWINDYMSLKQVNSNNPFTVPDGYFDSLSQRIESYKNLDLLKNSGGPEAFTVPSNYFESLAANIQSRIAVEDALNTDTGFTLPEGYFEALADNIQSRIAVDEALSVDTGFVVPNGYFDNLGSQIESRIFVEGALAETENNFAIPAGYFNKLNSTILDKTVKADETKQGGVIRKMVASTAFKYATAACFALVLGGGILLNEVGSSVTEHNKTFLHKQLSVVPVDEIQSYLQLNDDATDLQQSVVAQGAKVDDKELDDALKNNLDSVQ